MVRERLANSGGERQSAMVARTQSLPAAKATGKATRKSPAAKKRLSPK